MLRYRWFSAKCPFMMDTIMVAITNLQLNNMYILPQPKPPLPTQHPPKHSHQHHQNYDRWRQQAKLTSARTLPPPSPPPPPPLKTPKLENTELRHHQNTPNLHSLSISLPITPPPESKIPKF